MLLILGCFDTRGVMDNNRSGVNPGDRALLLDQRGHRHILTLEAGGVLHTNLGVIRHDAIIGQPWGHRIESHLGHPFLVLRPRLVDLIPTLKRATQIIYPKDAAYLLAQMDIHDSTRVIEGGTGSGSFTMMLAQAVAPSGHVYTYEAVHDILNLARKNLTLVNLAPYVTFHHRDIAAGFDQHDVDAVFLDVREPAEYLDQVVASLRPGGFFGTLVPTTNQVSDILAAVRGRPLADIEVSELLLRHYKPVPARLRPDDRMIGHTGFLVLARYLPFATAELPPPTDKE